MGSGHRCLPSDSLDSRYLQPLDIIAFLTFNHCIQVVAWRMCSVVDASEHVQLDNLVTEGLGGETVVGYEGGFARDGQELPSTRG